MLLILLIIYVIYFLIYYIVHLVKKHYIGKINDIHTFLNNTNNTNNNKHILQESNNLPNLPYLKQINEYILNDLNEIKDNKLKEMLIYATNGGKRIRSILLCSFDPNNTHGVQQHGSLFLEYLHASSLIIDDIMDGDTLRRNNECFHIKYGINNALIVSSYLLSLAFLHINYINQIKEINCNKKEILIDYVTKNFSNLCLGQYNDMVLLNKTKSSLLDLMEKKTASLFTMAYILAYIDEENSNEHKSKDENEENNKHESDQSNHSNHSNHSEDVILQNYLMLGNTIGTIFQLVDDFEDIEKDIENSYNTGNSNNNYVCNNGIDESYIKLNELIGKYTTLLNSIVLPDDNLLKDHELIIKLLKNKVDKVCNKIPNKQSKTFFEIIINFI